MKLCFTNANFSFNFRTRVTVSNTLFVATCKNRILMNKNGYRIVLIKRFLNLLFLPFHLRDFPSFSFSPSRSLSLPIYLFVMYSLRACDPQLESLDTTLRYIIIQKRSHGIYMVVSCAISISISGLNSRVKHYPPVPAEHIQANIGESVVSENTANAASRMANANGTKPRVSTTMTSPSPRQQINETLERNAIQSFETIFKMKPRLHGMRVLSTCVRDVICVLRKIQITRQLVLDGYESRKVKSP